MIQGRCFMLALFLREALMNQRRHNMVSLHFMLLRRRNATSLLLVFHLTLINLTDEPLSILFFTFAQNRQQYE